MKTIMMMNAGILVGILSFNSKRLIRKFIDEENDKHEINKLFGQYVSEEVKEKIIKEKKDMVGERKNVVVLFSDIRSFTSLSEAKAPEEIVKKLNTYFDKMVSCISANEGIVDKFIGDAIMAIFGGLIDLQKPCDNAFKAALLMQKELVNLNLEWKNSNKEQLAAGIGLHYGEVLQGAIGTSERKEFTVIGDTVNIASRLEKLSKEYSPIVLSDTFYNNLSDENKKLCSRIGYVNLQGRESQILIYRL